MSLPPPTADARLADLRSDGLPCVIDVEASGFGRGSYPIEVGVVLPDGSAYCSLVRPEPGWTHWDAHAQRLHGIARESLLTHGRTAAEIAGGLNGLLAGLDVYSDNWAHDYAWLATLFDAAGVSPQFRLHHLRELLDEPGAARFDDARDQVAHALRLTRHRASSDARVLQLTLARVGHPCRTEAPPTSAPAVQPVSHDPGA